MTTPTRSWVKSSYCQAATCLHAWPGHRTVWVRDQHGATLVVDHGDWRQLLAGLRGAP